MEFTVELVLKSFSGKGSSLELHVFKFSDSLPYGLEEIGEFFPDQTFSLLADFFCAKKFMAL